MIVLATSCSENVLIGLNPRDDAGGLDGGSVDGGAVAGGGNASGGGAGGASGGVAGGASGGVAGGASGGVAGGASGGVAGGASGGVAGGASGGVAGGASGGVAGGASGGSAGGSVVPDGGPPLLSLAPRVPLCAEPGELLTLEVVVENTGGSPAAGVAGTVEIPTSFAIQSAGGCAPAGFRADASVWSCDAGTIAALSSVSAGVFRLVAPSTRGSFTHRASVADAGWSGFTAITGLGAVAIDPTLGGRWDAGACQGTNIMSLSMCMPGDLVYDTIQFLPDASIISDDGIPATWAQSPSRRNLCFQSFGPLGGSLFRGESINARCFTGLTDRWETGETNFAAWIACY